ncbi:response regulator transcription factor [Chryseobacterium binzhouense]|uniref:response regulator transcription factor n=1 Tax=Chryseobacterium binzhouense TaxID=2593646 RepID=UPI0028987431|nr:response regulator transcription factor [Chryseobacterium binzhouense]
MYSENNHINFLLADDHSLIRQGMEFVIEDIGWEGNIFHASNLKQVLNTIENEEIDIVIIDAVFPDGNSLSIIPEIKKLSPKTKILVFSGLDEQSHSLRYINAGANGFLSKMSEEEETKNAVLKIYKEGKYLSSVTQTVLLESINNPGAVNPLQRLTQREFQIAEMYAKGLGNLEIANILDVKQNTISTIKKRIFEKLEIDNIVELIELLKSSH